MNSNLYKLIKKYSGKWVAFKPDTQKVVSSGKDAVKVYKEAQKKNPQTQIQKTAQKDQSFAKEIN